MNEVLEKDKNQVEVYIEEHYTDQNGGVIIKIKKSEWKCYRDSCS